MPVSQARTSPDDPFVASTIGSVGLLQAVPYPSPYFDLSQTYFPASIKELFQYCVYFYNTHCIIPAVVNKLASYPITDLVFATSNDELKKKWKNLFIDELNIPFELYQMGIDLGTYGNTFTGVYFPFKRFLDCNLCHTLTGFDSVEDMKINGRKTEVTGTCPGCKKHVMFSMKDKPLKNLKKIRIIRYDPMNIDIISDPVSGEKKYLWDVPTSYRQAILEGKDHDLFKNAPKIVLKAIAEDKKIVLNDKNLYHMKRPSLSGQSQAWGFPLIMHALKSLYYLQILKMSQEAIAIGHVVPLWVLFPQGSNGSSLPPAAAINLNKWKSQIETELKKWRKDKNYIPILNFPIGFEQIGGEGRALLLGPEVQQEIQQIIASMSVPQEFVFGGMTWTGSSITLRMLENTFAGTRDSFQRYIRHLVGLFSKYLGYEQCDIYMAELKMADDIQRQQILMNLEAAGKVSTTRLLNELGYDIREEEKLKKEEYGTKITSMIRDSMLQARAQGEAGLVSMDYQMKAQKEQMEQQMEMQGQGMAPGQPGQMGAPANGGVGPAQGGLQPAQQGGMVQDPNTGMMVDPNTGISTDPNTGQQYDQNGNPISPDQSAAMNPQSMSLAPSAQGTAQQPPPQMGGVPQQMGQEAQMAQQFGANPIQQANIPQTGDQQSAQQAEQTAQQGLAAGSMPPDLKGLVTRYATSLIFADVATQNQVLGDMSRETPVLASLVKQRMMELSSIDQAVAAPQQPQQPMPAGLKDTTLR